MALVIVEAGPYGASTSAKMRETPQTHPLQSIPWALWTPNLDSLHAHYTKSTARARGTGPSRIQPELASPRQWPIGQPLDTH